MTNDQLEQRILALEKKLAMQDSASTLPLKLDQALSGRGYSKLTPTQIGAIAALQNGKTASFYVALTSGGAVTHLISFTDGVLTTS